MTTASAPVRGRKRSNKVLLGVAGTVCLLLVLVLIIAIFGRVRGEEFSPDTFERRTFSYHEVPFLGIQVTPIRRVSETGVLESYVVRSNLVAQQNDDNPRWDLVSVSRMNGSSETDAALLRSYLASDGSDYWKSWSDANPEMAKLLWAEVAHLARRQMYLLIPDVMVCTQESADVTQLRQRVDQRMADRYLVIAGAQHQLGKPELAAAMLAEAMRYQPDREDLKRARAEALQAAGMTEEPSVSLPAEKTASETAERPNL